MIEFQREYMFRTKKILVRAFNICYTYSGLNIQGGI